MVAIGVNPTTLAYVATSLGVGFIIGMAIRKATSVLLTITGLYFLSLMVLANYGVLTINWSALAELVKKITGSALSSITTSTVLTMPLLSGIILGVIFSKTTVKKRKYWVRG